MTTLDHPTLSIGQFLPEYVDELRAQGLRAETIRGRVSCLESIAAVCGDVLTPASVVDYCRARELAPGTMYQYHSIAAGFSAWATLTGRIAIDAFAQGRRPRKPRYVARPAGTSDVLLLLEQAREPMRSWITLAVYAGLRCGEIARVSGRDLALDGDGWVLRIPEGKGSKPGSVPAHPRVVELLVDAEAGRLWPRASAQSVSQRANAEMRRLGARCRMHELRHAFATELYRQTRDVMTVQHALRHEHLETTATYIAFDDSAVRSAVACLAFRAPQRVAREVPAAEHDEDDDRRGDGFAHLEAC
ncbi:MAG: tyrosine-type recombinase/integrase [Gaiellales bacterium]